MPVPSRARGSSPATSSTPPPACRGRRRSTGSRCSEQTYRQTERVFDYEELEPVTVKGKAEPLALYRPLAPAPASART